MGAADLSCYYSLWLLRVNAGAETIDDLLNLAPLVPWMERIAAIGHGEHAETTAEEALAAAKDAKPAPRALQKNDDPTGIRPGTRLSVTPDDNARVGVEGALVAADAQEVMIRRETAGAGTVHVHFPRAGFETLTR